MQDGGVGECGVCFLEMVFVGLEGLEGGGAGIEGVGFEGFGESREEGVESGEESAWKGGGVSSLVGKGESWWVWGSGSLQRWREEVIREVGNAPFSSISVEYTSKDNNLKSVSCLGSWGSTFPAIVLELADAFISILQYFQ